MSEHFPDGKIGEIVHSLFDVQAARDYSNVIMLSLRRSSLPARRPLGKSGFTLVELLVVIAIIALLAGVAIGPITGAMKTAKDNAGMQTTHALYVADFQYSIDSSTSSFADGADAGVIAQALLGGGYITDPTIFYIGGGATTKYTGTSAATSITKTNVSWDFLGSSPSGSGSATAYNGLSTSDPDQLPLVWATGNTITIPTSAGTYGTAQLNSPGKNPYGNDGIPVVYKSGASKFLKANVTTQSIAQFIDNSYSPPASANYVVRPGSE